MYVAVNRRVRAPGTWCSLIVVLLIAASCGGSQGSTVEESTDLVPTSTVAANPQPAQTTTTVDEGVEEDPRDVAPTTIRDGLISALPFTQTIDFDQGHIILNSYENELILGREGLIRAIDVDTRVERQVMLSTKERRAEHVLSFTSGEHHLAVIADSRSVFDLRLGVDLRTMELTGTIPSDGGLTLILGAAGEDRVLQTAGGDLTWLDVVTMTSSDPLQFPDSVVRSSVLSDTGDLIFWHQDGSISLNDADTFEEMARVEVGVTPLPLGQAFHAISDKVIQYFDGGSVVGYIDRATWTHLGVDPDFNGAGGEDLATLHLVTKRTARLIAVGNAEERWYLLQTLDGENGGVKATHVVTDGDFDRGWTNFTLNPGLDWVGDRLFVQDHYRRIVEVDLSRIGEDNGPWVDPSVSWLPVLTDEEQEVADAVMTYLADVSAAEFTDNERVEPAAPLTEGYVSNGEGWQVAYLVVDGDFAWARGQPNGSGFGVPVVLERRDGKWLISADQHCINASFLVASPVC